MAGSLLLVVAAVEVVTRMFLYPASLDFARFASYPERARRLSQQPGLRVALIGNSATEEAVDPARVEAELREQGLGPVALDMFLADGSGITTWRSMVERYFWEPGLAPDLLVITYFESRLEDGSEDDLGRLAQFFTTPNDWPQLFRTDLEALAPRMEFLLSSGWATYAARSRIKDRVLALFVPDYKEFVFGLNRALVQHGHLAAAHAAPPARRYKALARTLERAREAGTKLCFIAFPMRRGPGERPYGIDPALPQIVLSGGASFVDLRVMPELEYGDYRDSVHVVASGRVKYTDRLAEVLAAELRGIPAR